MRTTQIKSGISFHFADVEFSSTFHLAFQTFPKEFPFDRLFADRRSYPVFQSVTTWWRRCAELIYGERTRRSYSLHLKCQLLRAATTNRSKWNEIWFEVTKQMRYRQTNIKFAPGREKPENQYEIWIICVSCLGVQIKLMIFKSGSVNRRQTSKSKWNPKQWFW